MVGKVIKAAQANKKVEPVHITLHRAIAGYRKGRSHYNVHASDLTKPQGFCARQRCVMIAEGVGTPDEFIPTSTQLVYDMGNVIQESNTRALADAGVAVGNWECVVCSNLHEFTRRPPACRKCGAHHRLLKYKEYRWHSAISGVTCGIDTLVDRGTGKLWVLEQKTLEPVAWKALSRPQHEHEFRTKMYLRIISESDDPRRALIHLDAGVVLYSVKGGYGMVSGEIAKHGVTDGRYTPYKEFVVPRADAESSHLLGQGLLVKQFKQTGAVPKGICQNAFDKPAQKCVVQKTCFGPKYPAGKTIPNWEPRE